MTTTAPPPPLAKVYLIQPYKMYMIKYVRVCMESTLKKQQYKYRGKSKNKTEKKQVHFQRKLESKPETELHQSN